MSGQEDFEALINQLAGDTSEPPEGLDVALYDTLDMPVITALSLLSGISKAKQVFRDERGITDPTKITVKDFFEEVQVHAEAYIEKFSKLAGMQ